MTIAELRERITPGEWHAELHAGDNAVILDSANRVFAGLEPQADDSVRDANSAAIALVPRLLEVATRAERVIAAYLMSDTSLTGGMGEALSNLSAALGDIEDKAVAEARSNTSRKDSMMYEIWFLPVPNRHPVQLVCAEKDLWFACCALSDSPFVLEFRVCQDANNLGWQDLAWGGPLPKMVKEFKAGDYR